MKRKILIYLLCLIFAAIIIFSAYQIISILLEYHAGEQSYDDLERYISLPSIGSSSTQPDDPETDKDDTVWPEVDFDSLKKINDDIVAWIYIEGTEINYPIVQGEDNDYYLYRMIDGEYNKAGSIFMDYRNQADFSDKHTIIYGHQMKNGSMFADVLDYKKQEFYDAHPTYLIMTPDKNYKVEIFAGYVASVDDPSWQLTFPTDEDFTQWLDFTMERSAFESNTVPTAQDNIVTLSTCSNEFNDARFVLVGLLSTPGGDAPFH